MWIISSAGESKLISSKSACSPPDVTDRGDVVTDVAVVVNVTVSVSSGAGGHVTPRFGSDGTPCWPKAVSSSVLFLWPTTWGAVVKGVPSRLKRNAVGGTSCDPLTFGQDHVACVARLGRASVWSDCDVTVTSDLASCDILAATWAWWSTGGGSRGVEEGGTVGCRSVSSIPLVPWGGGKWSSWVTGIVNSVPSELLKSSLAFTADISTLSWKKTTIFLVGSH